MDIFLGFLLVCLPFIWLTVSGLVEMFTSRTSPLWIEPELPPARAGRPAPLPRRHERDWSRFGMGLFKAILGLPVVWFTGMIFMWGIRSELALFAAEMLALATMVAALVVGVRRARVDRLAV